MQDSSNKYTSPSKTTKLKWGEKSKFYLSIGVEKINFIHIITRIFRPKYPFLGIF